MKRSESAPNTGKWTVVKRLSYEHIGPAARGAIGVAAILLLWEITCRLFSVPEYLLPPPSAIFSRMGTDWRLLLDQASYTVAETILGFAISVLVGSAVAILITTSRHITQLLMPVIVLVQLVPKIAIAPVILIWLGYGLSSKVALAFSISIFPIIIDMSSGLTMVDRDLVDVLRSLHASRWQIFVKCQIPNSLPYLFSGMRVAVTLSMIGAVVGEFVGGSKGLGYLIVVGTSDLKTALVFAAIFVLTIAGFLIYLLIGLAERIIIPWSADQRDDLMDAAGTNV